jgi:hypothetical protein
MADLVLSVDVTSLADARRKLDGFQKAMNNLSVNRLASGINSVQNSIKQLVEAQAKGTIGQNAYQKGLLELKRAYEQLGYSSQRATAAVRAYAAQLQRDRSAQQAARAAEELARAQAQAAERTRQLRMQFQQGYAASQRARQQVRDLNEAYRQGLVNADQYRAALARIRTEQRLGSAAAQGSTRGINGMGMVMQQTGYQVGDFLVQVQSGTNFMVAFGQQATQLVGILPMLGAGFMGLSMKSLVALSAGLGIAIPLMTAIGAAFMRTRQSAEESSESIETLEERLKSLDNTLREYLRTREAARMGITAEELLGIEGLEEVQTRLRNSVKDIQDFIQAQYPGQDLEDNFISRVAIQSEDYVAILGDLISAETRIAQIRQKQGEEQFRTFSDRLTQYQEEIKLQQTINQFGENSEQARQVRLEQAIAAEFRRIEALRAAGELTDAQALSLQRSAEEAERLAAVDIESGVAAAASSAAQLAERLGVSVSAASRLMAMGGGRQQEVIFDPRDPRYDRNRALMAQVQAETIVGPRRETPERGGAGGQDPLQQLREQIRLEEELLGKTEAQQRVIRALGVDWENYGEGTVNSLVAAIEEMDEFNAKVAKQEDIANIIAGSFGDAFMSIVDGTKSAKDAFSDMARHIISRLFEILVIESMVQSIAGAIMGGFGGGGPTRPVMRPTPRASGGSMMANHPYLVGEHGPELVIPGRSATVKNADLTNKAMGGESIVINNNINVSGGTDPAAIRQEVAKLMPQITNATKSAVIDARRRGGQMRAAFQ